MNIAAIKTYRTFLPFRQAWEVGARRTPGKEHIVVAVSSGDGATGYGTMSPLPSFSSETGAGAEAVINQLLAPALVGHDPFDLEGIHLIMDEVISGNHLAKSAVDMALFDLQGQVLNRPVSALLGGGLRAEIALCWAIAVSDNESVVAEARAKVEEGYTALKLKVGRDAADSLHRLKLVREAVGPKAALRLDINQHYTADESIRLINKAAEMHLDLEYVEQPVPKWDLDGLAKVNRAVETPIMVDEGVFSIHDVVEIIKRDAASIVNLKVGKFGGLYKARKAAAICEAAGLRCMIGCMLESGLAMLAGAHLAKALQPIDLACELIGNQLYDSDFIDMEPFYTSGRLKVPEGPGLGYPAPPQCF
ncbi:MAG TPA: dipeptide epimerase [Firmicutes bacterium]|nr:dipeptide epimerase [Bacillota bacterium]